MSIPQWAITAILTALIVQLLRKRERKVLAETAGRVVGGRISATHKRDRTFYWIEVEYKFKPHGSAAEYSGLQRLTFWCGSMEEAEQALAYAISIPCKVRYNISRPSDHEIEIATNPEE